MIRLEHRGAVAVATLCRAEKRNALTPEMLRDLAEAATSLREAPSPVDGEKSRALVLAGEGPVFCSGFDLSLCRDDELAMAALLTSLSHAARALRRLPIPVVCAAGGGAVAGGCALAAACDFVITDERAKMGYPVVRLGVSPVVSLPMLEPRVGWGRSRERMLDPETVNGAEAVRIGLAHECVPTPEAARGRAIEVAEMFAKKPPHGLATTKRWLNEIDGSDDDARADAALAVSLSLAGGAEERERLEAMWRR